MKEQIFRNYGNLLGPYDEISLRHEWSHGTELTASIAWVDPTNEIAASYDVLIPNEHYVGNQKPVFFKPLRPGIWKACIMIDLKLVAESQFLITPLTFFENRAILEVESLFAHRGPTELYTSTNFSEFMTNLKLTDSPSLRQEAADNSKKTGTELDSWVDSLSRLFWVIRDVCILSDSSTCSGLKKCQASTWSSRSPDPKSDMKYIGSKIPVIS